MIVPIYKHKYSPDCKYFLFITEKSTISIVQLFGKND